jgi:hypothetical protein
VRAPLLECGLHFDCVLVALVHLDDAAKRTGAMVDAKLDNVRQHTEPLQAAGAGCGVMMLVMSRQLMVLASSGRTTSLSSSNR